MVVRDITRSSRERHVVSKLYVFFIINNLVIFTTFGVCLQLFIKYFHVNWLCTDFMDDDPRSCDQNWKWQRCLGRHPEHADCN